MLDFAPGLLPVIAPGVAFFVLAQAEGAGGDGLRAVSDGWLIALVPLLVTAVLVPFGKWLANRWRRPLDEAMEGRRLAEQEVVAAEKREAEMRLELMFMKARNEGLEREIGHWESGRWSKG